MKNVKLAFILFWISIIIFMFIYPNKVQAAYPTYTKDWEWNYESAAYYYVVNLSSKYATAVKEAAANWFKTGYHTNPLYPMTRTYTKTESPMDFYKEVIGDNYGRIYTFL